MHFILMFKQFAVVAIAIILINLINFLKLQNIRVRCIQT